MKRKSSAAATGGDRIRCPEVSHKASKGGHAATGVSDKLTGTAIDLLIILVVIFLSITIIAGVNVLSQDPKRLKNSPEHRTARPVVERMREECGKTVQPQKTEGDECHVPASSRNTQADSVDQHRLEDFTLRLDRLEPLILQLTEKLVAAESVPRKSAPTECGSELEHVNVRLDRIESLLSQLSDDVNHCERTKASPSFDHPTQAGHAAQATNAFPVPTVLLLPLVLVGIFVLLVCLDGRLKRVSADKPWRRRQSNRRHVEAAIERLPVQFEVGAPQRGSEKSGSEDEYAASFENLELPADDAAHYSVDWI